MALPLLDDPTPAPRAQGRFPLVQPSHLAGMTQEQRLAKAKQEARTAAANRNLCIWRDLAHSARRFTGEPITELGGLL
jgi:hypothetical protein